MKEKKVYYGGDKVNIEDEESYKLYIKECHGNQASLSPNFLFKSYASQFLLKPLTNEEVFIVSGQSRFQLHVQQRTENFKSFVKKNEITNEVELDLSICKLNKFLLPSFPSNLTEELEVFRLHGMPLLIWPQNCEKNEVLKYLDMYYPDCAYWFREWEKVISWLNQKWLPLMSNLDLKTSNKLKISKDIEQKYINNEPWLVGLNPNCVCFNYIVSRTVQYERYSQLLQSYFAHRLQFSSGFHLNSLHAELEEQCGIRSSYLKEDAGFFNLIGNLLISCVFKSKSINKPYVLIPGQFVLQIKDSAKRKQCLETLIPRKKLETVAKRKKKDYSINLDKISNINLLDDLDSDAIDSEYGENDLDLIDHNSSNLTDDFPNRPVTKEIMENKGIVKYRHKRERNPRVHLRHKFRKATVRYRSRLAPIRVEDKPYGGEQKGIRVNLVKSHKFKR